MSVTQRILAEKIVAIVRLEDYDRAVETAQALAAGGISVLEFTLTGSGALDAIRAVRSALGDTVCVGIGTALTALDAAQAIDAGAEFVVTPALRKAVIAECVKKSVPVACGGFSATELLEAHEAGAEIVKLFPAHVAGPKYVKDILAPLPFLKIMPTGGIGAGNARSFLEAGAVAVGIGGSLVSNDAVRAGRFEDLTAAARACVAAVR